MEEIKQAIDAAYRSQVAQLYKVLSQAILVANGDDSKISSAKQRFANGLAHASSVREAAYEAAGL